MKINKNTLFMTLIYAIIILSIFSYEIHFYKYYSIFKVLISLIILFSFFLMLCDSEIKKNFKKEVFKNKILLILSFLLILSTFIVELTNPNISLSIIFQVVVFNINIYYLYIISPIILNKNDNFNKLKKLLTLLITIFGLITIYIGINGSLLSYTKIESRSASIFFDSNFAALLLGISVALNINNLKPKYAISNLINILGIYYTGSRGTVLSLVLALALSFIIFYKSKKLKKIFIFALIMIISIISLKYLYQTNYFRQYQGSNGRFEMYSFALKLISKSPVYGYGYGQIGGLLIENGFSNTSTHNSFIDMTVAYGVLSLIVYIIIIIKSLLAALTKKTNLNIIILTIFMLINMNTIIYSFGGIGAGSVIYTIMLGMSYRGGKFEN